jgi:hypothetical protein
MEQPEDITVINADLEDMWNSTPQKKQQVCKDLIRRCQNLECDPAELLSPYKEMLSILQSDVMGIYRTPFIEFIKEKNRVEDMQKQLYERRALGTVESLLGNPKASNPMPQTRSAGLVPHSHIPYRPNFRLLQRINSVDQIDPIANYLLVIRDQTEKTTIEHTYFGKIMSNTIMVTRFSKNGWPDSKKPWMPDGTMCVIDPSEVNNPTNAARGGYYIYLCDDLGQLIIDQQGNPTQDPNHVVNPMSLVKIINSIPLPSDLYPQIARDAYFRGTAGRGGKSRKSKFKLSRRRRRSRRRSQVKKLL